MDKKRRKINKQKHNNDEQKYHDVPLVKLKEQQTSLPAIWNMKCLRHFSICCPEPLSIMCHHNSKYADFHFNSTIHQLMFWLVPPVYRLKVGRPAHAAFSWIVNLQAVAPDIQLHRFKCLDTAFKKTQTKRFLTSNVESFEVWNFHQFSQFLASL